MSDFERMTNNENRGIAIFTEVKKTIGLEIALTSHASPRFKSVGTREAARAKNKELAKNRLIKVRELLKRKFRQNLKEYNVEFSFEEKSFNIKKNGDTHNIMAENMGSDQALKEVNYDYDSDKRAQRRVDIDVKLHTVLNEDITLNKQIKQRKSSATKNWAIRFGLSKTHNFSMKGIAIGGGIIFFELKNTDRNKKVSGYIFTFNFGADPTKLIIPDFGKNKKMDKSQFKKMKDLFSAKSLQLDWSGWTKFETKHLHFLSEFDGKPIAIGGISAGLSVVGGSFEQLSFIGVGNYEEDFESINVNLLSGDINTNSFRAETFIGVKVGKIYFLDKPKDTYYEYSNKNVKDSKEFYENSHFSHQVFFNNNHFNIKSKYKKDLIKFINRVSKKYKLIFR